MPAPQVTKLKIQTKLYFCSQLNVITISSDLKQLQNKVNENNLRKFRTQLSTWSLITHTVHAPGVRDPYPFFFGNAKSFKSPIPENPRLELLSFSRCSIDKSVITIEQAGH